MPSGIIDIMKRAALEAEDSRQPCDLRFGTVVSVSPLKVQITNQFTIPASMLIVPKHLTDYTVTVSFDWNTENASGGSGDSAYASHKHNVKSDENKKMTIHNALKKGDKVALIRKTGGQSYYILDRI